MTHLDAGALAGGDERVGGHVGVRDAGRAGGDADDPAAAIGSATATPPAAEDGAAPTFADETAAAGADEAAATAAGAAGAALGFTTSLTSATISAGVAAVRSACLNSGLTSARASAESSLRCSAPPPAGAAMRKTRSAGPSGAPKSAFGESRAKASVGSVTCSERQCGMAMPPGRPVADWPSRAIASARRPAGSCGAAGGGDALGEPVDDVRRRGAEVGVEVDQVDGDQFGHGGGPPEVLTGVHPPGRAGR